jgi:predicted small lipoprotein YifL
MKPTSKMRTRTLLPLLVALGAGIALAGCGQKGNLYLPNQKKKVPATAAPPTQPQPAAAPAPANQPSGAQ